MCALADAETMRMRYRSLLLLAAHSDESAIASSLP